MLNLFIPHVRAAGGFDSTKTLDGTKVPVSFISMLVMQPHRKVRSAWMAGLERLSRVLMRL